MKSGTKRRCTENAKMMLEGVTVTSIWSVCGELQRVEPPKQRAGNAQIESSRGKAWSGRLWSVNAPLWAGVGKVSGKGKAVRVRIKYERAWVRLKGNRKRPARHAGLCTSGCGLCDEQPETASRSKSSRQSSKAPRRRASQWCWQWRVVWRMCLPRFGRIQRIEALKFTRKWPATVSFGVVCRFNWRAPRFRLQWNVQKCWCLPSLKSDVHCTDSNWKRMRTRWRRNKMNK